MFSGDIKAAGAGEDNCDIINARIFRSNNAAAETAYGVFVFQLDGVVTAVFAELNESGRAIFSTSDVNAFEGEETAIMWCLFVEVGTRATGDRRFLAHNGGFTGDEDIRVGGGLGNFYILAFEGIGHLFLAKKRMALIFSGLEGKFFAVAYSTADSLIAIAGFSGDLCFIARDGELATLNGIGFILIISAVIFVGGIKLRTTGNSDVTVYFNCRGIMIRIYCVHYCTTISDNEVFRCTNPIAVSIVVCVVGAKIGIYCDATLNGDITTLKCFKRRTISASAIEGKGAPLIAACDNEVYLILGWEIIVNTNIGYRYIIVDRDGYCIRVFSELKIRTARFSGCKIPIVKIANFTIVFKFPVYSSNGDVLIVFNYFRQGGGRKQDKD